ncbi:MAG TPA: flagellar basal body rod protein FlgB [Syntrophorhabdaceae bacterium]|nr:flagellar basal body rod protein FlgB [Syntrophorhabdaceae bacterium]
MEIVDLIGKALGVRAFYHKVISGNIANSQTPAYKEKDIDFKNELGKRLGAAAGKRMSDPSDYNVTENQGNDGLKSIDGNTVDLEGQTVKLTENQLMYHALVQIAGKRFSLMKYIISEGKR